MNGKPAPVFGLVQANGESGIALDPGQRFLVDVVNQIGEDTILHWHGQTPPNNQDGVALTGVEPLIAAATTRRYDYAPRPGTHWMHSHHGMQEMQLMAAPLVVRSAEDLRLDAQEVVMILHDFTFRAPEEVMASLTGGSMAGMAMPGAAPAGQAASPPRGGLADGRHGNAWCAGVIRLHHARHGDGGAGGAPPEHGRHEARRRRHEDGRCDQARPQ